MTQVNDVTVVVGDDMMDFTRVRPRRPFRVDGDVFYARPALSAASMLRAVALNDRAVDSSDAAEQLEVIGEFMAVVLEPASAELMRRRLADDDNPVEIWQVNQMLPWLLSVGSDAEVPTPPSESSSTGSGNPASGTSSTATAPGVG